jgi:centrosomal protein CEP120
LTVKEDESINIKKRFKEEKVLLEQDKKRLSSQVDEYKNKLEHLESKYYAFKKDVDESPLSVLRNELTQKNMELIESESRVKQANE